MDLFTLWIRSYLLFEDTKYLPNCTKIPCIPTDPWIPLGALDCLRERVSWSFQAGMMSTSRDFCFPYHGTASRYIYPDECLIFMGFSGKYTGWPSHGWYGFMMSIGANFNELYERCQFERLQNVWNLFNDRHRKNVQWIFFQRGRRVVFELNGNIRRWTTCLGGMTDDLTAWHRRVVVNIFAGRKVKISYLKASMHGLVEIFGNLHQETLRKKRVFSISALQSLDFWSIKSASVAHPAFQTFSQDIRIHYDNMIILHYVTLYDIL